MDAKDVQPGKWLYDKNYMPRVLYDDGDYSFIWGKFENIPALGARWNNSYPSLAGNPTWYVEPDFVAIAILQRLLTNAIDSEGLQYIENIEFAIRELLAKMALSAPK